MQPITGGVSLRTILPNARYSRATDLNFTSCCSDSRNCRPGDLFIALVGSEDDGHDHIAEAVERGAIGVLSERFVSTTVPLCIVPDTRDAHGHICQALANAPCEKLFLVGVSGTSGKTAATMLLAGIFKQARITTGIMSSLGISDTIDIHDSPKAMSRAPEIAKHLSRFSLNGCTHAILEIPSVALARRTIAGLQLDAAVLTNLASDHLDIHGSIENYRRAQRRLFSHLKPTGFAVLNSDDPGSQACLAMMDHPTLTTGLKSDAQLTATLVDRCPSEQTFLIHAGNQTTPVRTRIIGDPHINLCLQATTVALASGLDLATIASGLESIDDLPGVLERVECGQPFSVYVDRCRTPHALSRTLHTLRQVTSGKLICVVGPSGEIAPSQRPLFGRIAEKASDVTIITANNPGNEHPLQMAHDVLDGYGRPDRALICPDRNRAIHTALSQASTGDTVLVSGKGHDTLQHLEDRVIPFDDHQVALQWLYEAAAKQDYPNTPKSPDLGLFNLN
jgi:UDP-N-acetylmuramoyl-L-alanyl-D-glutamate--2,6-diaminopimelate ligase